MRHLFDNAVFPNALHGLLLYARGGYDDGMPLHFAAWNGATEAVKLLLAAGCEPGTESGENHRQPPLGWAIVNGRVDTVAAMLEAEVPIEAHYMREAQTGLRGEFSFARGSADEYRQIIALLENHQNQ